MALSVRSALGDPIMMLEGLAATSSCPPGSQLYQGNCYADAYVQAALAAPCASGQVRDAQGKCIATPCKSGEVYRQASGTCVPVATAEQKGKQQTVTPGGTPVVYQNVAVDDAAFLAKRKAELVALQAKEAELQKTDMMPFLIAGGAVAAGLFFRMRKRGA